MGLYLGIDMGGTASRWVALDAAGKIAARGTEDGATGLIFDAAALAAFTGALECIRDALPGPVARTHLGITGAGFQQHPQVESQVSAIFGLERSQFSYSNDVVLAWHSAFAGSARGHLVSAGTGSIGITMLGSGEPVVVGGRGNLVDDGGSGSWIALRALDRLYRLIDDYGYPKGAESLAHEIFGLMGGADQDSLRAAIYGKGRGQIGRLAIAVAKAAVDNDGLALEIISRAGDELARLAKSLILRAGPAPIAFIGGVISLHPLIRQRIEANLDGAELSFPQTDAPLTAAQMARAAAG